MKVYSYKVIYQCAVGVVYRHFESRRRIYLDNRPSRLLAKEANMKKNKVRNRQRLVRLDRCFSFWDNLYKLPL